MDNDDNDYHSQSLRLASEESSKVSPVLRPYALPKFDFDEGHLRFDSLVENEVFLGIPSQEDNQWIEDFSRGTSEIEFSSSAADSCSIPRHNNVWSEAISSESVEMLLKSVGQEEMIPGESMIEESDAGNEMPSLTKETDPNQRLDDKADEATDPSLEIPHYQFVEGGSAPNHFSESVDGQLAQPQKVDLSAYECSGAVDGKTTFVATDKSLNVELKCTDEKAREGHNSLDESLNEVKDHSSSMVETEGAQIVPSDAEMTGKLAFWDKINDTSHEFTGNLVEERSKVGDFGNESSFMVDDEKLCKTYPETGVSEPHSSVHASAIEVMEKSTTETTTISSEKSANMSPEGHLNMVTVNGCNEVACSLEPSQTSGSGFISVAEEKEITLQPESKNSSCEKPSVASEGGCKWRLTEISNDSSHSSSVELNKESHMQVHHGEGSFREGHTSSGMQIEPAEISGLMENSVDDHVMLQKSVFVKSIGGEVLSDGLENGDDITSVHNADRETAGLVLLSGPAVSSDIHVKVSTEQDVRDCNEERSESLALDPSYTTTKCEAVLPCEEIGEAELSSLDKASKENVESIDGPECDDLVGNEPALDAKVEDSNSVAHNTCRCVSSLPLSDATNHGLHKHNDDLKSSQFSSEPLVFNEKDEMKNKLPSLELGDVSIIEVSDSLTVKEVPDDSAAEVQSEGVDQSANMGAEQAVGETCQGPPDPLSNSNLRSDGTESADLLQHREPVADKDHGAPSSEGAGGGRSSVVQTPSTTSAPIETDIEILRDRSEKGAGKIEIMLGNASNCGGTNGVASDTSSALLPPLVEDATREERSFTIDIIPSASLPLGDPKKDCHSVPSCQARETSKLVEKSSTPGTSQIDPIVVKDVPCGTTQRRNKRASSGGPKVSSERKALHSSGKSTNENARKGNHAKELTPASQIEKGDALSVFLSPVGTGKLVQLEVGSVNCSGKKPSRVASLSGSSIPDLNTSTSTSVLFQQPFSDQQQVQLRAQIFVYGSLIQGMAPDEACMVSAFGMSDGGRSIWEPAWRACMERVLGQKPHLISSETPVQSRSGVKALDQTNKPSLSQNKVQTSSKSTPSQAVSPMIPLSSPLWNISTPLADSLSTNNMARGAVLDYQALSPLHSYQTPAIQNLSGHTTSWLSQGSFPVPWLASSQSSPFDTSCHFSAFPTAEAVKLTPAKELTMLTSSIPKYASPITVGHGGSSSVVPRTSLMHDSKKVTVSSAPHSTEPKSRKRKKNSASEDDGQITVPVCRTESVSTPVANIHSNKRPALEDLSVTPSLARNQARFVPPLAANIEFSNSISVPSPSIVGTRSDPDISRVTVSSVPSIDLPNTAGGSLEKRVLGSEEIAKVEEAKLQAEEAAVLAAEAASVRQTLWSQLDRQMNSGLISDVEAKLASAAAAIAAASAVAKAAASAAKIASNAAIQAKLMADEALNSNGGYVPSQSDKFSLSGSVNSMANATPASILRVGDGNNGSNSVFQAAREVSRRRIEAASAASMHAENLDAVVKAAELAAEAVSQAGKIVALTDPLPLRTLVEAGPERYWKASELPSSQGVKSNNISGKIPNQTSLEEAPDGNMDLSVRPPDKEITDGHPGRPPHPRAASRKLTHEPIAGEGMCASVTLETDARGPKSRSRRTSNLDEASSVVPKSDGEGMCASVTLAEKDARGPKSRSRRASDLNEASSVVPKSDGSRSTANETMDGIVNDYNIRENSLVEVFKDNGDFAGAWYSANVLSLKDGKALVCYTEFESDEGSGNLKEWVPLQADGECPPVIRLAHPMTNVTLEGTRKRRRAAARDYTWSLGDRVDALMGNCWREGVIIEKNEKDETTLSVNFPAQGKTSVVRAWNLRPILLWKGGVWVECSSQGDTPQEKRLKRGSSPIESKGMGKIEKNEDMSEPRKLEESRLFPLSAAEKIFNIGSAKNDSKPETRRTMRSGLQKEGSKVIFGVPKPGKRRKFMEVSKHYVSDSSGKNGASTQSDNFGKYLMPEGSGGARGWKNNSKPDPKEKPAAESKAKGFKAGKPRTVSSRTFPQKDNSMIPSISSSRGVTSTENAAKNITSRNERDTSHQTLNEFLSSSHNEERADDPTLSSSQVPLSNAQRKMATSNAKLERFRKGKFAPAGGKLAKVEEKEKSVPEVVEPRRSNRRIQPTSRLLEGLQSSLIISKIPSVSHDKKQKPKQGGG